VLTTDALTALGVKGINGFANGDEALMIILGSTANTIGPCGPLSDPLLPKLPDQESEGSFTPGD